MYESFYNLSESPFRLTPDPRFYFSSSTHKRALTHLRFGFHQREGFVVITGKPGTGKTELMLHLLEGLPKERITYGKIVTSNLDANQTLQQVAAAYQIPAEGIKKGILLKKLEDFFLQQIRENKRLVLIVDEAHKLSINSLNELQMLTNFQLSGKAALQCFLSGHDTLKLKLHDPELLHLKQRVITSTFLSPLEKQETRFYIEHRLRCVGWLDDPKFNPTAYSLIHDVTEGIPRQINALCNRILLRAYAEQKHYIDEGMVSRAIDDVQSEPLATNPLIQSNQPVSPQPIGEDSESIQAMFERSMQQTSVFRPVEHYSDEDETLPLTSAVNFYPTINSANIASPVAGEGGRAGGEPALHTAMARRPSVMRGATPYESGSATDNQEDTLDDARKFSDALTNFHQQTTSPRQASANGSTTAAETLLYSERQSGAPIRHSQTATAPDYARHHRSTPKKGWAAPLAYGSVAVFLIAMGVTVWVYNFSADVLGFFGTKNSHDNHFVGAIKGLLTHEGSNASDTIVGDNTVGEKVAADKTSATGGNASAPPGQIAMSDGNTLNDPAVNNNTSAGKVDNAATAVGEINKTQNTVASKKENIKSDFGTADEKWDSGALGAKYLTQQTTTGNQPPETPTDSAAADDLDDLLDTPATADNPKAPTHKSRSEEALITKLDSTPEKAREKASTKASSPQLYTAPPQDSHTAISIKGEYSSAEAKKDKPIDAKPPVNRPQVNKPSATPDNDQIMTANTTKQKIKNTPVPKPQIKAEVTPKESITKTTKTAGSKPLKSHVADSKPEVRSKPESSTGAQHTTQKNQLAVAAATTAAPEDPPHRASSSGDELNVLPNVTSEPKSPTPHNASSEPANTEEHSKNVVILDTDPAFAKSHAAELASTQKASETIDKTRLNELLAKLTNAYEKGNLQELLSVLSKDVRSNDGSTRRDLKDGYRKLFNITDMRQMTISSVTWSKRDRFIHGKGEFELRVREKGADTVSSYGGIISLDVENRADGAVITQLNYDYKH